MTFEFKFPDIGEGIVEGELLAWKVKEGDTVAENQTLAEVETDKAVVELPSPRAGRVAKLYGAEGDVIKVGAVVATIEEAGAPGMPGVGAGTVSASTGAEAPASISAPTQAEAPAVPGAPPASPKPAAPEAPHPSAATVERVEEEVPYTGSVVGRLEEAPDEELPALEPSAAGPPVAGLSAGAEIIAEPPRKAAVAPGTDLDVLAMPSVRALAKELSVDLSVIRGTGPGGRILKQDVEDAADAEAYGGARVTTGPVSPSPEPIPSPSLSPSPATAAATVARAAGEVSPVIAPAAGGPEPPRPVPVTLSEPTGELQPLMGGVLEDDGLGVVERVPVRGVRRTMVRHMAESLAKQAQVTTMDEADVTILKRIRDKERTVATERGVRLTYLAFVIKACTAALRRFPRLNATLGESREEFLLKRYYNIGFAVDTKAGLVVPNIKAADRKSIFRIAEEIVALVNKAEDRQLDLADVHGGTFTISNYGSIGSTFATPVINYPEVAILGMGRVRELPVLREGTFVTRHILPLSLTFDHQLIDGAEAARFLNLVIGYLEDPDLLLLEGD